MAYCATALWVDSCVLPVKVCTQGHKQLWGRVGGGNIDARRVSCDIHGSKQAISNVAEKSTSGIAKILTAPRLGATLKAKYSFLLQIYRRKSLQIILSWWAKNRCANQKFPYSEIPCSQHLPPDHTANQIYHHINLRTILIISSHNLQDYINNV
jgi:hypothetical protein